MVTLSETYAVALSETPWIALRAVVVGYSCTDGDKRHEKYDLVRECYELELDMIHYETRQKKSMKVIVGPEGLV